MNQSRIGVKTLPGRYPTKERIQEIVEAMGGDAAAWAKKQLAEASEDEPGSTERLIMLAEKEKFIVVAFGLHVETGRKVDVEFTGFGEDAFNGVAFVTN